MKNYTKTIIDRAWFSRLLWHPARKWSGSILTTLEPALGDRLGWGKYVSPCSCLQNNNRKHPQVVHI